jgi:DNA-binding SARP family transcriptional activator/tetratricopeptide (TPR) repeat protein
VKFLILGSLEAWSGEERIALGGARAERILATLLLEANRMVQVPRLVEAAWDEQPPPTAAHQVRKIVADLRRRLPGGTGMIVTDGSGYRIALAEDQLDVTVFEIRLRRAREADAAQLPTNAVTQLQAALQLWRGPALAGMDSPVLNAAAVVLQEARLTAVERLMDLRLALGEAREVVAELRSLRGEHPLRETVCGQLMLALYRSGRQAEALGVYEETRLLLAEELGIDPGPELAKLHEGILRNEPELAAPPASAQPAAAVQPPTVIQVDARPPRMLPYDLSDFVGRTDELDELTSRVQAAVGRGLAILTFDGMAGVGKTTLALHAAHRLAEEFPDGQLFVDLHGYTPGREPMEPMEALDILLRALGVPGHQIPDQLWARSALWRVQAAGKKLVVLLDNAAETGQVRPLLPGAGNSLVMITSRPRLTGLDGAVPISLEPPPEEEGLQLLTRVLGADRVAGEPEEAQALIEVCGRLPLALRIAAARLHNRPKWTVKYLVDRLRDEDQRVGELVVDDRSVAAALTLSYQSMGADHRRMFRLLGLHPAATEIDIYAAAALGDLTAEKAEFLLEDLLDVRLLTQRQLGRYAFHDILRSFARSRAHTEDTEEEQAAALHRLLDYYLITADAAADLVQPGRYAVPLGLDRPAAVGPRLPGRAEAMAWFDAERVALVAAVRYAHAHGLDLHACHLPRALAYYLQLRGHMQDLQAVQQIAVSAARRRGDRMLEGRSLVNLSIPHWYFGRFAEALDCAERALAIAEEVGDRPSQGICLGRVGVLRNSVGQYAEALTYYERALALCREGGAPGSESGLLTGVSVAQAALGRFADALAAATRAAELDHDLQDRGGEVIGLVNAASAHMGLGDHPAARVELDRALELARGVGAPAEAVVLAHEADLARRLGGYDEAHETGRAALRLLQTVRRPAIEAAVANTLGSVHRARGEAELALEWHSSARKLAEGIGFRIELARALDGMAHALAALGNADAARRNWQLALDHFVEMGVPEADAVRRHLEAAP